MEVNAHEIDFLRFVAGCDATSVFAAGGNFINREIDYPDAARELEIVRIKVPGVDEALSIQVVDFVQKLREKDLFKLPGVAETIDWTNALIQLDKIDLDPETVNSSLGVLLKYQDDIQKIQGSEAAAILDQVKADLAVIQR